MCTEKDYKRAKYYKTLIKNWQKSGSYTDVRIIMHKYAFSGKGETRICLEKEERKEQTLTNDFISFPLG